MELTAHVYGEKRLLNQSLNDVFSQEGINLIFHDKYVDYKDETDAFAKFWILNGSDEFSSLLKWISYRHNAPVFIIAKPEHESLAVEAVNSGATDYLFFDAGLRLKLISQKIKSSSQYSISGKEPQNFIVANKSYQDYVKRIDEAALVQNFSGNILACNVVFGSLLEYPYQDLIGNNFMNCISGKDLEKVEKGFVQLKEKHLWMDEISLLTQNGQLLPVEIVNTVLGEVNNKIILTVFKTVSYKKELEESLKDLHKKYRTVSENIKDFVTIFDISLQPVYFSLSAEKYLGYRHEELENVGLEDILDAKSLEKIQETASALSAQKKLTQNFQQLRLDFKRKDGSLFCANNLLCQYYDPDDDFYGYVMTSRECSLLCNSEHVMWESEKRFELVFESIPIGIVVIDTKDHQLPFISYINSLAEKMFGLSENVAGKIELEKKLFQEKLLCEKCIEVSKSNKPWYEEYYNFKSLKNDKFYEVRMFKIEPNFVCLVLIDVTNRIQTQWALIESEKKYRLLADNAMDVISLFSLDLKMTYISPSIQYMLGYTPQEAIQKGLKALVTEESIGILMKYYNERLSKFESGKNWHYKLQVEIEVVHKDGHVLPIEFISMPIIAETQEIEGFIINARDISERKEAEKALKLSEERFEKIFQSSPEPIIITRLRDGLIWDVNHEFQEVLKYKRNEIKGKTTFDINLWPSSEDRQKYIDLITGSNDAKNAELVFLDQNKKIHHGIVSSEIVEIENEKYIITIARDITNRKSVEEKLFFQASILNQVRNSICVTDLNYRVIYWNLYSENYYGWKEQDVLNRDIFEFMIPEEEISFQKKVYTNVLTTQFWEGEITLKRKNNKVFLSFCSISLLRDTDGDVKGFIRVGTDISERKSLEHQLNQSQKMEALGRLTGGVAHDFNNLLQAILGSVELMERKINADKFLEKQISRIKASALRGEGLTRKLLAFSRQKKGNEKPIDINQAIKNVVDIIEHTIDPRIQVKFCLCSENTMVYGDENQIELVFLNIAVNAVDAIKPEIDSEKEHAIVFKTEIIGENDIEELPVQLSYTTPYVRIEISDTGIGIDEQTISMIFEPFFTTKETENGTGLGLAMSYGAVKNHHGEITVSSKKNEGTTFHIYLPK